MAVAMAVNGDEKEKAVEKEEGDTSRAAGASTAASALGDCLRFLLLLLPACWCCCCMTRTGDCIPKSVEVVNILSPPHRQ